MFLSADTMTFLLGLGLESEKLVELVKRLDADAGAMQPPARTRSAGAERQARYRSKTAQSVTSDVTSDAERDVTGDDAPLSLPLSPQTPQTPTHTRECVTTQAREADFDRFWLAYPRKVGKDAARRAYVLAIRRIPGPDPPGQILAGLARARPGWIGTEQRLIPHPTTWLNRGSWDDEAPQTPQTLALRPTHERPDPTAKRAQRDAANAADFAGAKLAAELRGELRARGF